MESQILFPGGWYDNTAKTKYVLSPTTLFRLSISSEMSRTGTHAVWLSAKVSNFHAHVNVGYTFHTLKQGFCQVNTGAVREHITQRVKKWIGSADWKLVRTKPIEKCSLHFLLLWINTHRCFKGWFYLTDSSKAHKSLLPQVSWKRYLMKPKQFFQYILSFLNLNSDKHLCGGLRGGSRGAIAPPKTYESNFIHHDFAQFRKQDLRYKAILPSIVLSQQCCEVYFISLAVVNP